MTVVFIPADTATSFNFTTPVVVTDSPACFRILTRTRAGLLVGYTVNGFWES